METLCSNCYEGHLLDVIVLGLNKQGKGKQGNLKISEI